MAYNPGGYKGYVSPERLKLEKKIPLIRKLYLQGFSNLGIANKLKVRKKQIESIIDELRGRSTLRKDGKKIGQGYAIPETETKRYNLYKENRISDLDFENRELGTSGGITSKLRQDVLEKMKADSKTMTSEQLVKKYKVTTATLTNYGIKGVRKTTSFIKPKITRYGNIILNRLNKNPSLITNQNELFKNIPSASHSSIARALMTNATLETGKKRFNIPDKIKNLIPKIYGEIENTESVFKEAGLTAEEIKKSITNPSRAVKEFFVDPGTKKQFRGTVFEHTFPRALIPYITDENLQQKLKISGTRTSPFLNSFKIRFDSLQKSAVEKFLEDGNLSQYNKTINKIRNKVRNLTGGYEIGYIKFDKNKNPIPVINAKPVTDPLGEFGVETTQRVSAFKNAKYTTNLLNKFKKNPNNIDFSTLRKDLSDYNISDEVIRQSEEAAKAFKKAEPYLGKISQFLNFAKNNLNNSFVQALFKKPGGKALLVTGAVLLPSALQAAEQTDEVVPNVQPETTTQQQTPVQPETTTQQTPVQAELEAMKAEANVKPFDEYNPETYPSNEEQKSALERYQNYILAAGAAAGVPYVPEGYKTARELGRGRIRSAVGLTGGLGKILTATGTPGVILPYEVLRAADKIRKGASASEILMPRLDEEEKEAFIEGGALDKLSAGTKPLLESPYLSLAFAEPFAKTTGIITKTGEATPGILSKVLRLGLNPRTIAGISRFAGPPGLALSAGLTAYDLYQAYQDRKEKDGSE